MKHVLGVKYVDIDNKKELLKYYDNIALLFKDSFGKVLDKEVWRWAYVDNPYGEPIISLALSGGKVIGHYAIIPLFLENKHEKIHSYLSMTTMVSPEFRGKDLFRKLAERVYKKLEAKGFPTFVFGFPNDNSTSGFVSKLGWTVYDKFKVYNIKKKNFSQAFDLIKKEVTDESYSICLTENRYMQWRTKKPGQVWNVNKGVGVKIFNNDADLMYISDLSKITIADESEQLNLILPTPAMIEDTEWLGEELFHYRFGFRTFNFNGVVPKFFVQMSMSDVF